MANINIIEKNEGTKIPVKVTGNTLILGDGELALDLSKREQDFEVCIDISADAFGMLTMGTSRRYVAQIRIPARGYDYLEDGVDDEGNPKQKKVARDFDISNVDVTLWSVEV